MKSSKLWRQLPAAEYAALFPAKPKALRKMAFGLRRLGATGTGELYGKPGRGNQVFTMDEWYLAAECGVSRRSIQRYIPAFERFGIVEVKRWRYRKNAPSANSYRLYFGAVIPENWRDVIGDFPVSARDRLWKDAEPESRPE